MVVLTLYTYTHNCILLYTILTINVHIQDFISSIGRIGRSSFTTCYTALLTHITTLLSQADQLLLASGLTDINTSTTTTTTISYICNNNTNNSNNSNNNNSSSSNICMNIDVIKDKRYELECLKILELLRINILFINHLLYDDYTTTTSAGGEMSDRTKTGNFSGSAGGSETRIIPVFILDACLLSPTSEICNNIYNGILYICNILKLQLYLLTYSYKTNTIYISGKIHPLYSPLIIQLCIQLLSQYFQRYVYVEGHNYDPCVSNVILQMNRVYQGKIVYLISYQYTLLHTVYIYTNTYCSCMPSYVYGIHYIIMLYYTMPPSSPLTAYR